MFRDNGLPDSYGILLDDIELEDMGEHPNNANVQKDISLVQRPLILVSMVKSI